MNLTAKDNLGKEPDTLYELSPFCEPRDSNVW